MFHSVRKVQVKFCQTSGPKVARDGPFERLTNQLIVIDLLAGTGLDLASCPDTSSRSRHRMVGRPAS